MLAKGALEIVLDPGPGFYSRLFLVEKATGGWRPVIDLPPLNGFVRQTPFKMETAASVLLSVRDGDFLASVDLKDAYFQIPVHRSSRKLLLRTVDCPPGLYSSVCSRVSLGALSRDSTSTVPGRLAGPCLLGSSGQATHPGIAVALSLSGDCDKRREVGPRALAVCNLLGHDHRYRCCQGLSHPCMGGKVPLGSGAVPYCDNSRCSALAGAVGAPVFAGEASSSRTSSNALSPVAFEDSLVPRVGSSRSPDTSVSGSGGGPLLVDGEGSPSHGVPFGTPAPDLHLYSNASRSGWGAHLNRAVSGVWSVQESFLHINLLEMKALFLALQSFQEMVTGHHVTAMCDNSTVVAYINRQSGTVSDSPYLLTR